MGGRGWSLMGWSLMGWSFRGRCLGGWWRWVLSKGEKGERGDEALEDDVDEARKVDGLVLMLLVWCWLWSGCFLVLNEK